MDAGKIVYTILMQGAAVFKRDAADAETAVRRLGDTSQTSTGRVAGAGTAVDGLSAAAGRSRAPLETAAQAETRLGREAEQAAEKTKKAAQVVGTAALGIGAALGAASVAAIKTFADFDSAVSEVGASTQASKSELLALSDAALDAGAKTSFSATEAANAEDELAKAGLSVADILNGGLTGSLALAAAGTLDVAKAGSIAATTLKQFNLTGADTGHVADLLAAGAGKAQGSVEDLGEGLKYAGPVASSLGVSLEETVGTLALFASYGRLAGEGGTDLRGVLGSLLSPSKQAQVTMEEYGVSLFDANEKFIGVAGTAQELKDAFGDLTDQEREQALGRIFGNEQITAAKNLMKGGAAAVAESTAAVTALGYATDVAAQKQDNLSSDVEKLGGSLDTALIKTGSGANNVLRDMTQLVTGLIDFYSGLPAPIQQATLVIGVGTAAILLLGGTALLAIPKIVEFRLAVATLTKAMPGLTKGARGVAGFLSGPWGAALLVAGAALAILHNEIEKGVPTQEKLTNSLKTSANAVELLRAASQRSDTERTIWGDYADSLKDLPGLLDKVSNDGVADWLTLTLNQQGAVDSLHRVGEALGTMAETDLPSAARSFKNLSDENHLNAEQQQKLLDAMPAYRDALTKQATALGLGADNTTLLKLATEGVPPALAKTKAAIEEQVKATEAEQKALEDWLKMISESDAAFIDLGGAYDTIVQKNQDLAQSTADATESSEDSWQDYYDGVTVNVDGYLEDLQKQVDAQNNWERNMLLLSGKVTQGTLDQLAQLGPEGAPLVAQLVNASGDELAKLDAVVAEKVGQSVGTFANTLSTSAPVIAAAAAQLGQGAADEIATKLANGTATVEQIIADYKLKVEGFNPVVNVETATAAEKINSLLNLFRTANNQQVSAPVGVGVLQPQFQANGGRIDFFANGGATEKHVAQYAKAGDMRVWAEPETGGEYYVPMAESKRARSLQIAAAMVAEMGYQMIPAGAQRFADGGFTGAPAKSGGLTWTGDIVLQLPPGIDGPSISKLVRAEVNQIVRETR
ncbi:phage tail tape measure protein [Subtercola boreus]|uniref:Phage tail tape measure protein n=1 Tax=Subtercola boreus TaxID=120213 RepID=A0A3E0VRN2_9MICO|nr:phage tail tape measure protein [Subtercola boreus]RFA12642.1 phage tail tape measure protein [Subtercola boreus]